jgi:hypothetical protein
MAVNPLSDTGAGMSVTIGVMEAGHALVFSGIV